MLELSSLLGCWKFPNSLCVAQIKYMVSYTFIMKKKKFIPFFQSLPLQRRQWLTENQIRSFPLIKVTVHCLRSRCVRQRMTQLAAGERGKENLNPKHTWMMRASWVGIALTCLVHHRMLLARKRSALPCNSHKRSIEVIKWTYHVRLTKYSNGVNKVQHSVRIQTEEISVDCLTGP